MIAKAAQKSPPTDFLIDDIFLINDTFVDETFDKESVLFCVGFSAIPAGVNRFSVALLGDSLVES